MCPEVGLLCHYESGPCALDYLCNDVPVHVWHHQDATCFPAAVPGYTAQNGDVCAFVGDVWTGGGNCLTTATCEPDHTWSVVTSLGPDGFPCP
jgi:hypothetical protein